MGADLTFRTSQLQMLFGYLLFSVDTNGISCFLETTKESLFCFSKSQRVIQHCSKYLVFEEDVFESKSIIDKTLCQNLTLRKEITDCGRGNTANRQDTEIQFDEAYHATKKSHAFVSLLSKSFRNGAQY